MKHFYKLILLSILLPALANAQSNYKPGYVVNLIGDTTRGFIDYKEWDKNPKEILFKNELNSPAESLTVKNTDAFGVNGTEYFKRFGARISRDVVLMRDIKQGIDTSYIADTVFLHLLSLGKNVSLYGYTDEIKTRYYVVDGASHHPEELVYRVYLNGDNSNYIQSQDRYIIQLRYLAKKYNMDNVQFEREVSDVKYTNDLVKIIQLINGDTRNQFTPKTLFGTRWYAGIGVTDNNMMFKGIIHFANNISVFPKISAGFDLIPNKNTQKLFVRAEVSLSAATHSFANAPDQLDYANGLHNVKQQTISITPQVIYSFYNTDMLKGFIGAGLAFNMSSYNKYYYTENFGAGIGTTTYKFPYLTGFWQAFPIKAGLILNKKLEMYLGYTLSSAITADNNYTGDMTVYEAGINYLFGVK